MSDVTDDNLEGGEGDSNAAKVLRAQNKKLADDLAAANASLADVQTKLRRTDLADALKTHGAPEKLAKFYTGDDTSPEAVLEWLKEDGELFGWEDPTSTDDAETQQQAAAISKAAQTATPARVDKSGDLLHQLQTLPRAELIARGLIRG